MLIDSYGTHEHIVGRRQIGRTGIRRIGTVHDHEWETDKMICDTGMVWYGMVFDFHVYSKFLLYVHG